MTINIQEIITLVANHSFLLKYVNLKYVIQKNNRQNLQDNKTTTFLAKILQIDEKLINEQHIVVIYKNYTQLIENIAQDKTIDEKEKNNTINDIRDIMNYALCNELKNKDGKKINFRREILIVLTLTPSKPKDSNLDKMTDLEKIMKNIVFNTKFKIKDNKLEKITKDLFTNKSINNRQLENNIDLLYLVSVILDNPSIKENIHLCYNAMFSNFILSKLQELNKVLPSIPFTENETPKYSSYKDFLKDIGISANDNNDDDKFNELLNTLVQNNNNLFQEIAIKYKYLYSNLPAGNFSYAKCFSQNLNESEKYQAIDIFLQENAAISIQEAFKMQFFNLIASITLNQKLDSLPTKSYYSKEINTLIDEYNKKNNTNIKKFGFQIKKQHPNIDPSQYVIPKLSEFDTENLKSIYANHHDDLHTFNAGSRIFGANKGLELQGDWQYNLQQLDNCLQYYNNHVKKTATNNSQEACVSKKHNVPPVHHSVASTDVSHKSSINGQNNNKSVNSTNVSSSNTSTTSINTSHKVPVDPVANRIKEFDIKDNSNNSMHNVSTCNNNSTNTEKEKLLQEIQKYRNNRDQNKKEYYNFGWLRKYVNLWGYSKTEKLNVTDKIINNNKPLTSHEKKVANQGKLGKLYKEYK